MIRKKKCKHKRDLDLIHVDILFKEKKEGNKQSLELLDFVVSRSIHTFRELNVPLNLADYTYSLSLEGHARALIEEDERPTANHYKGFVWDWKAPLNAQCSSTALLPKEKKKEKGKTRESEKERDEHGHVESSQPFLGTKKDGIGGRGRHARWKPLWRRPRQIWQLAGRVHMWARKGRKGPPRSRCGWKRERAARISPFVPLISRDPSSLPLLLVRNCGGQRGIHSCTHSQNATRVRMCPVHARGPLEGVRMEGHGGEDKTTIFITWIYRAKNESNQRNVIEYKYYRL